MIISIHAPAKGATKWYNRRSYKERFQSTHPQRVRQLLRKNTAKIYYFNPRTRKGCDFEWVTAQFFNTYFNPRTRKGCDVEHFAFMRIILDISIHAPAKGATFHSLILFLSKSFQSTHPQRVRLYVFR